MLIKLSLSESIFRDAVETDSLSPIFEAAFNRKIQLEL